MQIILTRGVISIDRNHYMKSHMISIFAPYETSDGMFACKVNLQPPIIVEDSTIFGVDMMDAVEMAIEFLNTIMFEGDHGMRFEWPDGSQYKKQKIGSKYVWSAP